MRAHGFHISLDATACLKSNQTLTIKTQAQPHLWSHIVLLTLIGLKLGQGTQSEPTVLCFMLALRVSDTKRHKLCCEDQEK